MTRMARTTHVTRTTRAVRTIPTTTYPVARSPVDNVIAGALLACDMARFVLPCRCELVRPFGARPPRQTVDRSPLYQQSGRWCIATVPHPGLARLLSSLCNGGPRFHLLQLLLVLA